MRTVLMIFFAVLTCQSYSQTQEFTLQNGLKVLVKEDHRAPIAVSMIWYNVGSADEPGGITGVSHALEHLMFKGTPKYPLGVFQKRLLPLADKKMPLLIMTTLPILKNCCIKIAYKFRIGS